MRRSRKPLTLYGVREFESHPHRHFRINNLAKNNGFFGQFWAMMRGRPW